MEQITNRLLAVWIAMIVATLSFLNKHMDSESKQFYTFGPNPSLVVFGLQIDTYSKYGVIVVYCFVNSLLRSAYRDILLAWQTNSVQDITKTKKKEMKCFAYEVSLVTTIYGWMDWYIYINLLLSQVDMILIEICSDLFMSFATTRYYLEVKEKDLEECLI
jgi:hypothetical protein